MSHAAGAVPAATPMVSGVLACAWCQAEACVCCEHCGLFFCLACDHVLHRRPQLRHHQRFALPCRHRQLDMRAGAEAQSPSASAEARRCDQCRASDMSRRAAVLGKALAREAPISTSSSDTVKPLRCYLCKRDVQADRVCVQCDRTVHCASCSAVIHQTPGMTNHVVVAPEAVPPRQSDIASVYVHQVNYQSGAKWMNRHLSLSLGAPADDPATCVDVRDLISVVFGQRRSRGTACLSTPGDGSAVAAADAAATASATAAALPSAWPGPRLPSLAEHVDALLALDERERADSILVLISPDLSILPLVQRVLDAPPLRVEIWRWSIDSTPGLESLAARIPESCCVRLLDAVYTPLTILDGDDPADDLGAPSVTLDYLDDDDAHSSPHTASLLSGTPPGGSSGTLMSSLQSPSSHQHQHQQQQHQQQQQPRGRSGSGSRAAAARCPHGPSCANPLTCRYEHTRKELKYHKHKEFLMAKRKREMCDGFADRTCVFMHDPASCRYAHGPGDATCALCGARGHVATSCPAFPAAGASSLASTLTGAALSSFEAFPPLTVGATSLLPPSQAALVSPAARLSLTSGSSSSPSSAMHLGSSNNGSSNHHIAASSSSSSAAAARSSAATSRVPGTMRSGSTSGSGSGSGNSSVNAGAAGNGGPVQYTLRKTKLCWFYEKGKCKHMADAKSCKWAHGVADALCQTCRQRGHFARDCPSDGNAGGGSGSGGSGGI